VMAGLYADGDEAERILMEAPPSLPSPSWLDRVCLALEHVEREADRWRSERDAAEAKGYHSRARKLAARVEYLDDLIERSGLWGVVHPPLVGDGSDFRRGEVQCRYCPSWVSREEAWETGGQCRECWRVSTKRGERQGPRDPIAAEMADLVDSILRRDGGGNG
jgi:hypothetical protein